MGLSRRAVLARPALIRMTARTSVSVPVSTDAGLRKWMRRSRGHAVARPLLESRVRPTGLSGRRSRTMPRQVRLGPSSASAELTARADPCRGVAFDGQDTQGEAMTFQVGDRVVAEAESTNRSPRAGTVREVLRTNPPRYRIAWDDGRESIYTPAAGALCAEATNAGTAG